MYSDVIIHGHDKQDMSAMLPRQPGKLGIYSEHATADHATCQRFSIKPLAKPAQGAVTYRLFGKTVWMQGVLAADIEHNLYHQIVIGVDFKVLGEVFARIRTLFAKWLERSGDGVKIISTYRHVQ